MNNKNDLAKNLYDAVLRLVNQDEARLFFRDLLTEAEINEFGRRWQTAKMLDDKKPYGEIEKTTGLSSATVARISKWLHHGMGGYRLMLDRVKNCKK